MWKLMQNKDKGLSDTADYERKEISNVIPFIYKLIKKKIWKRMKITRKTNSNRRRITEVEILLMYYLLDSYASCKWILQKQESKET